MLRIGKDVVGRGHTGLRGGYARWVHCIVKKAKKLKISFF
jgi:hypothetical protein